MLAVSRQVSVLAFFAAVLVLVGLVACGGSPDHGAARASLPDWSARAGSICRDAETRSRSLARKISREIRNDTQRKFLVMAKRQDPLDTERLAKLRALERPREQRTQINRFLDLVRRADDELVPLGENWANGNLAEWRTIQRRLRSVAGPMADLADELQVSDCVPGQIDPRLLD